MTKDPLQELEPFDPSLKRIPVNVFEVIAWILTYRETIFVRTEAGNTPISKLPPHQAAATVSRFVDQFTLSGFVPHRVPTDDVDRENMQHASWQVLALRDWTKVAKVWEQMKTESE